MSSENEKPRILAAAEEVDKISRSMLVWANTFPEKPVTVIKYEFLTVDDASTDETGMALSTIQGTYDHEYSHVFGGHGFACSRLGYWK